MTKGIDVLFDSVYSLEDDVLLAIGEHWGLTDISAIRVKLYSYVYFGDIDYGRILDKYDL